MGIPLFTLAVNDGKPVVKEYINNQFSVVKGKRRFDLSVVSQVSQTASQSCEGAAT